jgi:hypothetical protein
MAPTTKQQPSGILQRVVIELFGSKSDDVTGGCRKFHIEKCHNFYSSQISLGISSQGE